MKILQVINSLGTGGAEKLLLESIPLYHKKGIQMDLLVLDGYDYPFIKELYATNSCDIFSLGKGSIYNPLYVFKIIRYFKRYDIIHVHLFPALYWVALAKLLSFSKVKLIYTEHSTTNRRMQNFFLKMIDSFIYSFYDKIICISTEVAIEIKKHVGLHKTSFELINNGVNIFKILNETGYNKHELGLPISESDIILMQVSSFQYPKDQPTLIKSLQHLPENVHLLLVGEGELKYQSEELTKELQLTKRVHFLGIRMDVPKLLKTVDIVILSTYFEGLSLSSIEGLASGKPFVASEAPGLIEIVNNAGILFSIQDHVELANTINKLLTDKTLYNNVVKKY